jgi:hypothetical protein
MTKRFFVFSITDENSTFVSFSSSRLCQKKANLISAYRNKEDSALKSLILSPSAIYSELQQFENKADSAKLVSEWKAKYTNNILEIEDRRTIDKTGAELCECGISVLPYMKNRHLTGKSHIDKMKKIEKIKKGDHKLVFCECGKLVYKHAMLNHQRGNEHIAAIQSVQGAPSVAAVSDEETDPSEH